VTSVEQRTISRADAQRCIEAAEQKAAEIGLPVSVAVVDGAGVLKAFARTDGASLLSVAVSQRKAYTAAAVGAPTDALFGAMEQAPSLLVLVGTQPGLALIGGGAPIQDGGAVVGAVGVSGGSAEQDAEVAAAAAAAVSSG
jgi:glc operon protein GlcG